MRMVDCLSHCGTMDKTEQECGAKVEEIEGVKLEALLVKDQAKISEVTTEISPPQDNNETKTENGKPVVDTSCNGVEEKEKLVNGDIEKTDIAEKTDCEPNIPDTEKENTFEVKELHESGNETTHKAVNDVDDDNVKVNGTSEKENETTDCVDLENSIKEPDKSEGSSDCQELEKYSDNNSSEEDKSIPANPEKEEAVEDLELENEEQGANSSNLSNDEIVDTENSSIGNGKTVEISEMVSCEEETDVTDKKEKQPQELQDTSTEVIESSISSGPPSLIKEVASDDNSIKSDHVDSEESLEIDQNILIDNVQSEISEVETEKEVKNESKIDEVEKDKELEQKSVELEIDTTMTETKTEQPVADMGETLDSKSEKETVTKTEEKSDVSVLPSKSLSKGQKLDQLLSKITTKAETSSQKANPPPQKHAKARKSCASSSSNIINKPSAPPSITSLTFNVKELEKKGVLDIPKPKPSKRKAFEPIKIPSPDKDQGSPKKSSPVRSPVRSPLRSPSKTENPFFKKKLIRRRKKKFRNTYKLPGEKVWKKPKAKKSEVIQLASDTVKGTYNVNKQGETYVHNTGLQTYHMQGSLPVMLTSNMASDIAAGDNKTSPGQKNALDMLTMNSRKSFPSASSGGSMHKKARKTVRQTIDPATHRTLDFFLKSGSHSRKMQDSLVEKSMSSDRLLDIPNGDHRKRKAMDQPRTEHSSSSSPEEKKRKMEIAKSPLQPQQMITLLPTGSPPLSMPTTGQPILPASGTGSQILLSPGSSSGPQAIIQNGTFNGLPVFQLFNNQSIVSSQPAQFVAIAQSQGRSLLTSSSPSRSTTLIQPKGVPVLFTPVPLSTASIGSPPQMIPPKPGVVNSVTSSMLGNQTLAVPSVMPSTIQQQHSVLKHSLTNPRMQLPNGQYIDLKLLPKDVPNGLYPVTPPKTPEEQRSETGSQNVGEEMEAALGSVTPDKDVIPLCTCKISGASFQKMATIVTFCQALDSIDGKVLGCCNKVTNSQLARPAVKIPFLALCDSHRKRLRLHQCCPGCGHYCTQGKFLQCRKEGSTFIHNFHEQCQVTKDGKNFCPHCGETSSQYEVHLSMSETKQSIAKETKPTQRAQIKARIGVVDKKASGGEDSSEEAVMSHILEKSKKVLSTVDVAAGPDRHSLERVLSSLVYERPKKYRHLPKCLYTPAYDNDLERVVYMLEDGYDPNELYDDLEGQSALHAAAAVGSLPIVHVLIQAGASPHHQDKSLKTPLMFASENNHPDVVKYLIRANTTVDAKASDGMSALHLAAKAGHVNIINILLDTERINIDITDDGGWTPLIWAAEHMEVDAVRLLLKRKSDPNLRDSEENTTMHWAAFSGSVAIAELLLAAGCDLDSLNMHGDRPLHIAARQDHYECVVLFLARGADVEAKNNKGESPLECCIEQNTAVYLALKVNKQLKSFGAKHMGKPEKLIHRDLSKGRENIPIPCVNGVDDEGEPRDYLYVVDNIETTCLNINRVIGSLQSCQCKDDCSSIYCACGKNSVRCWFDKYNRLTSEFNMIEPPLIFECNRACECWTTCNNRVVQNGVMSRLQVFKTVGRGWGCKTLVDIPRGTFICEYIGEHISDSEADRREDDSYLFDLDNKDGETYCIDARRYGNVARFINHLCEPNLTPVKVFVDSQDLRFPRICLFANRDIKAQEELGFDYGEKFWIIKWKQFTCTCGSLKCRYSTDTIQKTLEEYRQRHEIDGEEMQE